MQVPFFKPSISDDEIQEVEKALRSGWLTTGPRCREFEAAFAEAVGARHAVALNSCTAALHLALESLGVGPDNLVLVPALTFAATAEVVQHVGAIPVFVDVDPATLCMDPQAASETLTAIREERPIEGMEPPYGTVEAIVPVHYGGLVADVARLRRLCRDHGLAYVEDCAHALPAQWREAADAPWQQAGAAADVACYSFYANKTITTGEGGMATTGNERVADRMRLMSLHGMDRDAWRRIDREGSWDYEIVEAGYKYNMTDLAASLGLVQLRRAQELWERRRRLVARYSETLAGVEELELPSEPSDRRSSWHLYAVRLGTGRTGLTRDALIERLRQRGVGTSVHWRPLHMQAYYRDCWGYRADSFPVAAREFSRLVSLPLFPDMTDAEQDYVVRELCSALASPPKPSG